MVEITAHFIEKMIETIVKEIGPRQIYLFGSQAGCGGAAGSDVDILIIEDGEFGPGRSRWSELIKIRKALKSYRVPKDILVYSHSELEKWKNSSGHLIAGALREGKLLYERP